MHGSAPRNPLSLHQLNALDVSPVELIDIAGRLGVPYVCLFTHSIGGDFPLVTAANEAEVMEKLVAAGVAVYNVEYVVIAPDMSFDGLSDAFARSARLGARRMTVHDHDIDEARALNSFREVCRIAADQGLEIGLEWTAVNPAIDTIAKASRFIDLAGQPNAALAVDVLHLSRGGGTPADVAALPPGRVGYAQVSDGPKVRSLEDYVATELIVERLPPGDGELPIAAFMAAIPAGVVVDVEAPQARARQAGVSAFDRARIAVEAARRFVV